MLNTTTIIKTKSFEIATYMKGAQNSPKIALILPGKLDSKDYAHLRNHVDMLASKGYLALSFDPPGTWESAGDISIYSMTSYLQAVNELIEYFGNKPTLLVGHSRGGSVAIWAGVTNKYVSGFISIISKATRSSKKLDTSKSKKWKQLGYSLQIREAPMGYSDSKTFKLPYSFLLDEVKYNMSDKLYSCKKPKLFFAMKNDPHTSLDTIQNYFNKCSNPKQLHILAPNTHNYHQHPKVIEEVNSVITKFLKDNKLI